MSLLSRLGLWPQPTREQFAPPSPRSAPSASLGDTLTIPSPDAIRQRAEMRQLVERNPFLLQRLSRPRVPDGCTHLPLWEG